MTSPHTIMRAYQLALGTSKQLVAILLLRGLTSVSSLRLPQMALVTICKSSRRVCTKTSLTSSSYVAGGRGNNNYFLDDIWVLSLPSFTWTQIYQGSSPRYSYTCHVAGSRTMITVGGAANTNYSAAPCDWEYKGVGVLDMSDVTWGSVYNASAGDYAVPSLVVETIGGRYVKGLHQNLPCVLLTCENVQSNRWRNYDSTVGRFQSDWPGTALPSSNSGQFGPGVQFDHILASISFHGACSWWSGRRHRPSCISHC